MQRRRVAEKKFRNLVRSSNFFQMSTAMYDCSHTKKINLCPTSQKATRTFSSTPLLFTRETGFRLSHWLREKLGVFWLMKRSKDRTDAPLNKEKTPFSKSIGIHLLFERAVRVANQPLPLCALLEPRYLPGPPHSFSLQPSLDRETTRRTSFRDVHTSRNVVYSEWGKLPPYISSTRLLSS